MSKSLRDQLIPQITVRCVHFTGIQHETCGAGVDYKAVCDSSVRPYRRPCHADSGATTSCEKRCLPTPEQIEAEVSAWEQLFARVDAGECAECGTMIASATQDGGCLYAAPCGHRIGQGDADTFNRDRAARAVTREHAVAGA